MEKAALKPGRYILIAVLVVVALVSGFDGTAYAANSKNIFGKHHRVKENSGVFPAKRHKPKKQHNSKHQFRSPYSGGMLYGKPVKQK